MMPVWRCIDKFQGRRGLRLAGPGGGAHLDKWGGRRGCARWGSSVSRGLEEAAGRWDRSEGPGLVLVAVGRGPK